MTCCPDDESLVRLLEERLGPDELAEIERHLEGCGRCQDTLEGLSRDRIDAVDWRPWADVGPESSFDGVDRQGRPERLMPRHASRSSTQSGEIGRGDPWPATGEAPRVDGYDLLGKLGQGGMGVVYRARQRGLDRLVALKMVRAGAHAEPEQLTRFRIEVRAVAKLKHPNIVQVYDVGEADGLPYVALELLEGGSLEARVGGTPQPEAWSAGLIATLARAIASAHRDGVVHRDLKPANVLFARDGTPKVADFGLAKRLDVEDGQTHSGQVMGSPSFMAPEQARGREVGPSADIYSLGALLYELLTGRPPFKGPSPLETLYQVVNEEPVPPTRLRPGLSGDLETICLKSLAKEPHRRYLDADALADDLARHLAGEPILARPVAPQERAWKWARRHPSAALLAAAGLALALGVGLALARWRDNGLAHDRWVADRRAEGRALLAQAGHDLEDGRRDHARETLHSLLVGLKGDPALAEIAARARALIARIDAEVDARRRLAEFNRWRREAQIGEVEVAGLDHRGQVEATRRAALAALGAFDGEPPATLDPADRDEVRRGLRELRLTLAEATARAQSGEAPAAQAAESLRILDRAASQSTPTRAHRLLRASALAALGDGEAAAVERRAAEATPPVDALDHVMEGRERARRRQFVAAIAEFEEAIRIEPDQFRAQLLLAVAQLQDRRPEPARAGLNACLRREPRSIDLHVLRGFAYGEEANKLRAEAREASPRLASLEAEANAKFEAAEADYRAAMGLGPDDDARYVVLVNRGVLRVRSGRLDEAVADLREAVRLRPDHFEATIPLGQALGKQGRADLAIEQFTRGLALRPDHPALYRCRALARVDRGRPGPEALEAAIADLSQAIRFDRSGSADAAADRARRGRLNLLAGRPMEALADADEAIRIDPTDPDAPIVRVRALLELKRFPEVVGACDEAIARARPSAELFELRGLARAGRRDYAGAIADATQALAIDPTRSAPLRHRGWAYIVSEAPKLALHDFDEAVRVDPDDPESYTGRGFAQALLGNPPAAAADAEESLRRGGEPDARTTYNAARIFAKAAAAEPPRRGSARRAAEYRERSHALLRLALERTPPDRRPDFWRDVIAADPVLASIRKDPRFSKLAGQFGRAN